MSSSSRMASSRSPVPGDKSQPLHDFQCSELKWKWRDDGNSRGDHQHPKIMKSLPTRPLNSAARRSPLQDLISRTPRRLRSSLQARGASDPLRPVAAVPTLKHSGGGGGGGSVRSLRRWKDEARGFMRSQLVPESEIPSKSELGDSSKNHDVIVSSSPEKAKQLKAENKSGAAEAHGTPNNGEAVKNVNIDDDDDDSILLCNLRRGKPINMPKDSTADAGERDKKPEKNKAPVKSAKKSGGGKKNKKKEKEKLSISISLTKQEIEEDFFAMTGSKPPRRLKKRDKTVQKNLDMVFPGLCLHSISPDSYKVKEN